MVDKFKKQAEEIVSKMTLEEAASQLKYDSPAIPHLNIPAYNWWNEALHGVARAGTATVFPQAIGLAAMFDPQAINKIGQVIATESRAKYNMQASKDDRGIYKGLTMWSPNINIFRDPRWGRGQETYGEDPYLTSVLGVEFIEGMQGDDEHMKVAACAKHFAVHSGPEAVRHSFDAVVSDKDLYETYLPAFEAAVKDAKVEAIMGGYNRTNGEPCCGSETLLQDILRDDWGFEGHVVSDCWAIMDFHEYHHVTRDVEESAALAINSGCDLNCGVAYQALLKAVENGLVEEETVRKAAMRVMETRFKLGILGEKSKYEAIPYDVNDCDEHKKFSLETSEKSIVMLKNNGVLPLNAEKLKTVSVIGPNADSINVLKGNYTGTASEYITNLDGVREALSNSGARILYSEGSHLYKENIETLAQPNDRIAEAAACAEMSDIVFLCLGLDASIEGEQGDAGNSYAAGDRENLYLPECQQVLLNAVLNTNKPVVLVLNMGGTVDLKGKEENCAAILHCWYSGAQGGRAMANIAFGKTSPAGRLPLSFVKDGTLPEFTDYAMKGRTYKYTPGDEIYPFGFGLSYSEFDYTIENLTVEENNVKVKVKIINSGNVASDEVVQIYVRSHPQEYIKNEENSEFLSLYNKDNQPRHSLCGVKRIHLDAGQALNEEFIVDEKSLQSVLDNGEKVLLKGKYTIFAGGSQPDKRSIELMGKAPFEKDFVIE